MTDLLYNYILPIRFSQAYMSSYLYSIIYIYIYIYIYILWNTSKKTYKPVKIWLVKCNYITSMSSSSFLKSSMEEALAMWLLIHSNDQLHRTRSQCVVVNSLNSSKLCPLVIDIIAGVNKSGLSIANTLWINL